jgi:proteasome lid subunit RPN8/RPN11
VGLIIEIDGELLKQIHMNGEAAYPEEGAGLILGVVDGERKQARTIMEFENAREVEARHNRYLIAPLEILRGEQQAARLGLDILGVFHSHPDHPNRPSEYDREFAIPWYSYVITSVNSGKAVESRSWLLSEDRSTFTEEYIEIKE